MRRPCAASAELTLSPIPALSPSLSTDKPALALPDKPSIAVLPFTNLSGDPEQNYFVDGIVEDIITSLSRIHWLFVIARNSSFTYKGKAVDVKQVGSELGVRYVLEGNVREAGNRVRITGQLVDATTGARVAALDAATAGLRPSPPQAMDDPRAASARINEMMASAIR